MQKIIINTFMSLIFLIDMNIAYAIDPVYRSMLEKSGCTQVSEMYGCDINKSKAENTKLGFKNDSFLNEKNTSHTPLMLRDLIGVQTNEGNIEMISRGYKYIRMDEAGERSWSYWYNSSTNSCVTIALYNDLYNAVTDTPYDCIDAKSSQK
ncbi:hypothetical protein [Acinetobacter johnsonii]|uniref:hypothetical protein n=1 Tax=Acinetobacter johnsonii TaxID=40214 RepID=UPI00143A397F|nr:hypothetical protein [Acinetobacter johnsonii]NKG36481.1 hypothetical protein [Acinetobacter johnsonii]